MPKSTNSRFAPAGDVRMTVNVRDHLHRWLKVEAAKRRTTVGEMVEKFIIAEYARSVVTEAMGDGA